MTGVALTLGQAAEKRPQFSIVIPAHNEESVIARCLNFVRDLEEGEVEVVVAANGCTDQTVSRASQFGGVTVLDLAESGKTGALNAADAVCTVFPRVYLDADIVVDAATLRRLAERLHGPEARVASPRVLFATVDRPWPVRAFYDVYARLPYVADALVGLGLYAVSAAGRARWQAFPPITADDLFVQRHFTPAERIVLEDEWFEVQTPRTLRDLVRVRTRTAFGNSQLADVDSGDADFASTTSHTQQALREQVRRKPTLLPAAVVYTSVMLEARRRARSSSGSAWHRDASTR